MKSEEEIKERIRDLQLMILKDRKNKKLYDIWFNALYWVLDLPSEQE